MAGAKDALHELFARAERGLRAASLVDALLQMAEWLVEEEDLKDQLLLVETLPFHFHDWNMTARKPRNMFSKQWTFGTTQGHTSNMAVASVYPQPISTCMFGSIM